MDIFLLWPRHQGGNHGGRAPAKNRQGPCKINWIDHVPSGLGRVSVPDGALVSFFGEAYRCSDMARV